MAYTLSPYAKIQFFDNDGEPAVGYQLFTYTSGGSVKTNTYTTSVGTPNTNPIILDAAGRAVIYLDPGVTYRFVAGSSGRSPSFAIDVGRARGLEFVRAAGQ